MADDFPAAHSMDTYWFAVDRDGRVAVFSSGEAGAVPNDAGVEDPYDLARLIIGSTPQGISHVDLAEFPPPGLGAIGDFAVEAANVDRSYVLMYLDSLDSVADEIAAGTARPMTSSRGTAVYFSTLPVATYRRLHESRACRGCCGRFLEHIETNTDIDRDEEEPSMEVLAQHGFYQYSHQTENWISGPYGRVEVPAAPLHVDQLPPNVRDQVTNFRFDGLSFAESPLIQPAGEYECVSWEQQYLTLDGKRMSFATGEEVEGDEDEG